MSRNSESSKVQVVALATSVVATPAKMGVVRYLQLKPQPSYIASILKKTYKSQVKTESEWDEIVENLLNAKV